MGAPGFWDDQERAAEISAEHARAQRRLETFRALEADAADLDELAEMAAEDAELAAELDSQLASIESPARRARGGAAVQRRVRLRRRRGHGPLGRRRHRFAGLGRDAAADVPALGRAPRLRGRDEGGVRGRGGGDQVGDLHRQGRERLRPVRRRARRPPAGADLALRRAVAPPHRLRPGRRRAAGRRRGRGRARRGGAPRSTPTAPRAPAASTSTRPTPRSASPTCRPGSSSSARTSARRRRTRRPRCGCCGPGCSRRRSASAPRSWRPSAASRRRPSGARRSAATRCTPRPGSRTTAPGYEVGDANRVLDGDLDGFVREYLLQSPREIAERGAATVVAMAVSVAVGVSDELDPVEAFDLAAADAAAGLDGRLRPGDRLRRRPAPRPRQVDPLGGPRAARAPVADRLRRRRRARRGPRDREGPGAVVWGLSAPGARIATHHLAGRARRRGARVSGLPEPGALGDGADRARRPLHVQRRGAARVAERRAPRDAGARRARERRRGGLGGAVSRSARCSTAARSPLALERVAMLPCVSQGATPVGPEMTITAARGNVIEELASKPAIERLREAIGELDPHEQALAAQGLMLGIVIDENQPDYERGDFLVRPIIGADPEAGSLALGERVRVGQTVRMHVRDGATADEDLRDGAARPGAGARRRAARRGRCCSPATAAARTCSTSPTTTRCALEDALGAPAGGLLLRRRDRPRRRAQLPPRLHRDDRRLPARPDGGRRGARRPRRPGAGRGRRRRRRHLRGDRPRRRPGPGADRAEAARGRLRPRRRRRRRSRRRAPSSFEPARGRGPMARRRAGRGRGASPARRGRCSPPSARRSTSSATSPGSRP